MEISTQTDGINDKLRKASGSEQSCKDSLWYLEKINDNNGNKFIRPIDIFPFHIGRNKSCELSLPIQNVSKIHAVIVNEGKSLKIIDRESTNGTYINGKKIMKSAPLKVGDVIHFNNSPDNKIGFRVMSHSPQESIVKDQSEIPQDHKANKHTLNRREKIFKGKDIDFSPSFFYILEVKNKELRHIKAKLSSVSKGVSLTLNIPFDECTTIQPNDTCIVRFTQDGKALGFKTHVIKVEIKSSTSMHIILKYPEIVSYISYRRFTRYKTNLSAKIRKSVDDNFLECKIVDISLGGCKVSFPNNVIPDLSEKLLLTIVDMVEDIHVAKVHERRTSFDYQVGFEILYFGGKGKMKKFEEILHFHAPVWM